VPTTADGSLDANAIMFDDVCITKHCGCVRKIQEFPCTTAELEKINEKQLVKLLTALKSRMRMQ
jgi:hypothetical protein